MKLNFFVLIVFLLCFSCQTQPEQKSEIVSQTPQTQIEVSNEEQKLIASLEPFFEPMGEPEPFDWLASFPEEGQTFAQYINSNPTLPTAERKTIYIQPIGKFNENQLKIINTTAEYMRVFFQLDVKLLQTKEFDKPLSLKNYRIHPATKKEQIRTGYVLDEVLPKMLTKDAAALIAFTNEDLYPNDSMNYVFGQASLANRVGVWSLYRLSDGANYEKFLLRTMKIAVHETGHMFSIHHCTKYRCVMSGTNHLEESDKRPIDACPEDTAKICWMNKISAVKRFEELSEFCRKNNLAKEAETSKKKADAVR